MNSSPIVMGTKAEIAEIVCSTLTKYDNPDLEHKIGILLKLAKRGSLREVHLNELVKLVVEQTLSQLEAMIVIDR